LPKERIGEQVYVFISESYAQVTSTVILTSHGNVVVDSLAYPSEAEEVRAFARRANRPVTYLINTHGHLDHVACNFLYPDSAIVAHSGVRQAMLTWLRSDLAQAQESIPELRTVRLRPPSITGSSEIVLRHGGLTLRLIPLPGHSADGMGVYVEEERILVAGDAVLPVPHFVGGDPDALLRSLQRIRSLALNTIVQGHGDVILKGEVRDAIDSRVRYIRQVRRHVSEAVGSGATLKEALRADVEAFGGSRLDLDGLTEQLHEDNIRYLYELQTRSVSAGRQVTRPE